MRRLMLSALASAAIATATIATPAQATITITTDQQTGQGAIVLLPVNQTGTQVMGETQAGYKLNFTSTQQITTPANGQARIQAVTGDLNNILITAADGGSFEFIEFNLFSGSGANLVATITGLDQFGNAYSYVFGDDARENVSGENFFFAATDTLQSIKSIGFTSTGGGFADIRQIRVGPGAIAAVPEPGTWALMLIGFGGIGASLRRRRARQIPQFA
ncbi:PEPxxWA-CTERM sorting domain-containing protein [Sphingomonas glaciei]|uniref:PEPxxWA-CTERM sorting domain-containing protein n=1 Tax=Sphingomonas glaciei TaxID=2938948 RepID=A0ABY5MVG6_9SPHN|nr:PEPxxWA-CTERM sorting domain-containing protein [Sphingomonas glaciei]UUR08243.1 PEPxxWA-CTERM sorting domain-containing protein [Sphingomonas glaciei]